MRLLKHEAVVEGVGGGIGDLDDVHLRFLVAVFGRQEPAFFVDAAAAVTGDATLVDDGIGSTFGKRPDPLGVDGCGKGRVEQRWDVDALQGLRDTAVAHGDYGGAAVLRAGNGGWRLLGGEKGCEGCQEQDSGNGPHGDLQGLHPQYSAIYAKKGLTI